MLSSSLSLRFPPRRTYSFARRAVSVDGSVIARFRKQTRRRPRVRQTRWVSA
jgi:hypothetical protein